MSHHFKNTCPECKVTQTCRCAGNKIETRKLCTECASQVNEDAAAGATSAASVAGMRGSLFGGSMPRKNRRVVSGIPVIRYRNHLAPKKARAKLAEGAPHSFAAFLKEGVNDMEKDFDSADIISKLARNAEVSDELDGDELAVFGMEDSDGGITKVYVPAEQGKDFEKALGDALRHTKENGQTEIASLLYDLKGKFKIVDVKWPTVQEDEEETNEDPTNAAAGAGATPPPAPGAPGDGNDPAAAVPPGGDVPPGPDAMEPMAGGPAAPGSDMPPTGDNQSDIIAQILDMLKADAEARKAESAAKAAEANAKEAEAAAKMAQVKIQGEESVLDAEAYFKQKKDEKKEGDRLKMLAKFRQETQMSTPDEPRGEVKPAGAEQPPAPAAAPSASPAPAPQAPGAPGKDEEEEQLTHARRFLLGLINRG